MTNGAHEIIYSFPLGGRKEYAGEKRCGTCGIRATTFRVYLAGTQRYFGEHLNKEQQKCNNSFAQT